MLHKWFGVGRGLGRLGPVRASDRTGSRYAEENLLLSYPSAFVPMNPSVDTLYASEWKSHVEGARQADSPPPGGFVGPAMPPHRRSARPYLIALSILETRSSTMCDRSCSPGPKTLKTNDSCPLQMQGKTWPRGGSLSALPLLERPRRFPTDPVAFRRHMGLGQSAGRIQYPDNYCAGRAWCRI